MLAHNVSPKGWGIGGISAQVWPLGYLNSGNIGGSCIRCFRKLGAEPEEICILAGVARGAYVFWIVGEIDC